MFVLLTLLIPRSFYLSEYECLTAVNKGNQTTGHVLFGSVTFYVQRREKSPPVIVMGHLKRKCLFGCNTACKSGYFTEKELYKTLIKC